MINDRLGNPFIAMGALQTTNVIVFIRASKNESCFCGRMASPSNLEILSWGGDVVERKRERQIGSYLPSICVVCTCDTELLASGTLDREENGGVGRRKMVTSETDRQPKELNLKHNYHVFVCRTGSQYVGLVRYSTTPG